MFRAVSAPPILLLLADPTAGALLDTRHRMAPYEQSCNVTYVEDTLENFAREIEKYGVQKLDFAYLDTSHNCDDSIRQLGILAAIVADDGIFSEMIGSTISIIGVTA